MAKILIVDDSTSIRQMVAFVLEKTGHQVVEANSAEDALTKLSGVEFHLVVSDLNMPGMDGINFSRTLRQMPAFQSTPILIISTETSKEVKLRGKEAGVNGWIAKPFNPEQLQHVVQQVVGL